MKLSQTDRLLKLLSDGEPHSTPEIQIAVYGGNHLGTARIASRVTDLRDRGHVIESWKDKDNPTVWFYVLRNGQKPKPKLFSMRTPEGGVVMVHEAKLEEAERRGLVRL